MARHRRRYNPTDKYKVIYDTLREGHVTSTGEKIIFALNAVDAIAMFELWMKGEMNQWGIHINPREILYVVEEFEHPEND